MPRQALQRVGWQLLLRSSVYPETVTVKVPGTVVTGGASVTTTGFPTVPVKWRVDPMHWDERQEKHRTISTAFLPGPRKGKKKGKKRGECDLHMHIRPTGCAGSRH